MTAGRTVTVLTLDRGPVILPEPVWCLGQHEDGLHACDLLHQGPETTLTVVTRLGQVDILAAGLSQAPLATDLRDRRADVAVDIGAGVHGFGPAGLRRLAAGLVVHAGRLRDLSYALEQVRAEGGEPR